MMQSKEIKVLLVDDHMVVRKGLLHVLESADGITVIGEAENGEEALYLAKEKVPDVILMDVELDRLSGIQITELITMSLSTAKVIGLSTFASYDNVVSMMKAGAKAFVLKDIGRHELVELIRQVGSGAVIEPTELLKLLEGQEGASARNVSREDLVCELGQQQKRVLALLAKGFTNPEIAKYMEFSIPTARYHVSAILKKLDVSNRSEAAAFAVKNGLVDL